MNDSPRKASLLVIFLTVFVDLLGFGMVLPLLPIYAKQFTTDESGLTIALLMSSFSAMQFLCAPLWGRLSDRVGRRPVLMIGLVGSAVFYALFGIATAGKSLLGLFLSRVGAGIAGATIPTAQAYIADCTTLETRAKGMALVGAAFGLGFTFGPLLGAAALFFSTSVAESPLPGYTASALSAVALILAILFLPESLRPDDRRPAWKLLDLVSLRDALATPSIGALLFTSFISVLAFGSFEQTLSLLLKSKKAGFHFEYKQVLYFFAYIGLVLSLAQGVLVRRLSTKVKETTLAAMGVVISVAGFCLLALASIQGSQGVLMVATATEVTGFAFITPSLQSLISRRSDPARQGGILGVSQSMGSLARILGPMLSVPLFHLGITLPYWAACGLMLASLAMVAYASRRGGDYPAEGAD